MPAFEPPASTRPSDHAHSSAMHEIYQHPLGYLLGLEGVALLKAFAGEYDEAFTQARIADVRRLLDIAGHLGPGIDVVPLATDSAYDGWAPTYDDPENGLFAIEEHHVRPILDTLPVGETVDLSCGTGRHTGYLAALGHEVRGFDTSPLMLDLARAQHPMLSFELADVRELPLPDESVDNLVCALALTHIEDLQPVFAEASRALRPGGRFVISDTRGYFVGSTRFPLSAVDEAGNVGYLPGWRHSTVEYLRALLDAGFRVRDVQEPLRPEPVTDANEAQPPQRRERADLPPDIWALHAWATEATNAAFRDDPVLIVWDLELTPSATCPTVVRP